MPISASISPFSRLSLHLRRLLVGRFFYLVQQAIYLFWYSLVCHAFPSPAPTRYNLLLRKTKALMTQLLFLMSWAQVGLPTYSYITY